MMNYQDKTKPELIKELQKLQQEYISLKESYLKDITERKHLENALQKSEARYNAMISNISDVIGIIGADGKVKYRSPNVEKWFGWRPQDLIGADGFSNVHPDEQERVKNEFSALLEKENSSITSEYKYRCKDGSYKEVEMTVKNLMNDPVINGVLLNYHDITDRKQAEYALKESEKRFKAIFNQAPIAIALLDTEGHTIISNLHLSNMVGYSNDELSKMKFTDFTYHEDVNKDMNQFIELIGGRISNYSMEKRFVHKNGNLVWGNLFVTMIQDENSTSKEIIGMAVDITERKQTELLLKESEKEFRDLAESMPQIVWTTRADGWTTYFNQQWVDYTGLTLEESSGDGWNIPFHPEDKQKAWNAWQNAVNNNAKYSIDCRIRRYDGIYQWWLVRAAPQRGVNGEIVKWFGTCTNIERIKQDESYIRESEEKYRNLFNNSEIGMFRTRLDGSEVLEFNEKYLKILGYTIDEVKGILSKNIWVNKHEREKMVEQIKVEGQVVDLECELLTREGKVINCITSLKLYSDTGILEGSILDITDRMLAEKTLWENEKRMRDIIFSIGDWVWEVDENWIYTYSSQKGYDLFDSSHENILGKTPFDFMPADEAKRVGIIFSELASKKAPIKDLENWNIGGNDEKICLLANGVPVLDKDGNLKGYRGVDKDITDFKKNEAALKQMNEVMTSLHQRLENIREEEQAQISRNIHDHLGQSLTSLKFDLGTLIDKTERGSKENLKLEGMIEMVTQIIRNVQRISSELRPPALDELGLSAAMEWYCEEFMERTGLQLHLELDNVQTENMNKNLALYKVLKESLTNIIRHAGAKNVLVKLCVSEKAILLTIKDDGIGITPDKINSVKSLGILGMFERIRQFGGDIEISNPDKKGTRVQVRLSVK